MPERKEGPGHGQRAVTGGNSEKSNCCYNESQS